MSDPSTPLAEKPVSPLSSRDVLQKSAFLLMWNVLVALFVAAEFINIIVISKMLWPDQPFHALEVGSIITFRLWADGLCALLWGVIVDNPKINRKHLFMVTGTLTGIMIILNGFAPVGGGYNSYYTWIPLRILIGVFMSAGGPLFGSLSADLLPSEGRSQFFGFNSVVWGVFQTLGMIISAIVFQLGYWRFYYWGVGVGVFVWVAIMGIRFHEPKRAIQEKAMKEVLHQDNKVYNYTISKQTFKETMLSRTNMLILFEGIFTNILLSIINFISLPYIQSPPRNISPVSTSLFMLMFGVPGSLIGSLALAKLSDKYGAKGLKNRIIMIVVSMTAGMLAMIMVFSLPLPSFTLEQGDNFRLIFNYPIFILMGIFLFLGQMTFAVYGVNQMPIIQEINLPEARGKIASWNQLIEIFSYGSGPVLAGFVLTQFQGNYQLTIQVVGLITLPGILLWFLAFFFIEKDHARIQQILAQRANELQMPTTKDPLK